MNRKWQTNQKLGKFTDEWFFHVSDQCPNVIRTEILIQIRFSCRIISLKVTTTRFDYTRILISWMMDRFIVTDRMMSARESGVKAEVMRVETSACVEGFAPTRCVRVARARARVCVCVCVLRVSYAYVSHTYTFLPFVSLLSSRIKVIQQMNRCAFTAILHSITFLDDDTFSVYLRENI